MKKRGLLNPEICRVVAEIGHGDTLTVGDAGLPIPRGCQHIDVSVIPAIPRFIDVVSAIVDELDVERAIVASEIVQNNPQVLEALSRLLGSAPLDMVPHEQFKQFTAASHAVIRTGEVTPFANVILVGGVSSVFPK